MALLYNVAYVYVYRSSSVLPSSSSKIMTDETKLADMNKGFRGTFS